MKDRLARLAVCRQGQAVEHGHAVLVEAGVDLPNLPAGLEQLDDDRIAGELRATAVPCTARTATQPAPPGRVAGAVAGPPAGADPAAGAEEAEGGALWPQAAGDRTSRPKTQVPRTLRTCMRTPLRGGIPPAAPPTRACPESSRWSWRKSCFGLRGVARPHRRCRQRPRAAACVRRPARVSTAAAANPDRRSRHTKLPTAITIPPIHIQFTNGLTMTSIRVVFPRSVQPARVTYTSSRRVERTATSVLYCSDLLYRRRCGRRIVCCPPGPSKTRRASPAT